MSSCYNITSPVSIEGTTHPVILKINDTSKPAQWLFQNDVSNNLKIGSSVFTDALLIDPTTGLSTFDKLEIISSLEITGATVLNSGTITVPTGPETLIGRDTTDTLTNKTVTDNSNIVRATQLATTGSDIIISGAAPPVIGQVLRATTPTTANWQTVASTGNNIAYQIVNMIFSTAGAGYTAIGYFPWSNTRHSAYTNGAVTYRTVVSNRNLNVRFRDVTNGVTLGSDLGVTTTAGSTRTFTVINPTSDAQVELQIQKATPGGVNPQIFGAILEYNV